MAAGPVFDPSAQHGDVDAKIVAALERVGSALRLLLRDAARERGLSPIQAQFLVHLRHRETGVRRVGRLAVEFDLTPATVSDAVASLEGKGLLVRETVPEDRRAVSLRLSEEGERLAEELAAWAEVVREALPPRSPEEKETVMLFLMGAISSLQNAGVVTVARMCVTCRFFRPDAHPGSRTPHHCALLDVPLARSELRLDCPEHETAERSPA